MHAVKISVEAGIQMHRWQVELPHIAGQARRPEVRAEGDTPFLGASGGTRNLKKQEWQQASHGGTSRSVGKR